MGVGDHGTTEMAAGIDRGDVPNRAGRTSRQGDGQTGSLHGASAGGAPVRRAGQARMATGTSSPTIRNRAMWCTPT